MKQKDLELAHGILGRIKNLDSEIIELEKLAIETVNDKKGCSIRIIKSEKPKDEKPKETMNTEEYLRDAMKVASFLSAFSFGSVSSSSETENERIKIDLSDTETLYVLELLLAKKQGDRVVLINDLSNLGVRI